MSDCALIDSLKRYVGQTVTIFTTSGGISGSGFTGVLASVCDCSIKLITDLGAAPTCPLGSSCGGRVGFNRNCNCRNSYNGNWVGSVTEIPICKIAGFTHNAI